MPIKPWYSTQGIDTLGNPSFKSSVPAWGGGGQMSFTVTAQSHLFCKKAEKLLIKHAS